MDRMFGYRFPRKGETIEDATRDELMKWKDEYTVWQAENRERALHGEDVSDYYAPRPLYVPTLEEQLVLKDCAIIGVRSMISYGVGFMAIAGLLSARRLKMFANVPTLFRVTFVGAVASGGGAYGILRALPECYTRLLYDLPPSSVIQRSVREEVLQYNPRARKLGYKVKAIEYEREQQAKREAEEKNNN